MLSTALLLLPDFLLILGGSWLRRREWVAPTFWRDVERLVYFVFFPALLFRSLARSPLSFGQAGGLLVTGLVFTLVGIAAALATPRLFRDWRDELGGCIQCAYRFNSYIALAAAGRLFGDDGRAAISLMIGSLVPVVNVAAVAFLVGGRPRHIAAELARNPLIIACVAGALWQATGWPLPGAIDRITSLLADATLALALLAVGAALRLDSMALPVPLAAYLHAIKLVLVPAVAWFVGGWLGLGPSHRQVAVLMAAVPTATSAYILAVQLKRDGAPVAFLISSGTLLAMLTLPAWVAITGR